MSWTIACGRLLTCAVFLLCGSSSGAAQTTALPGTLEAEDFDQGAPDVAYVDTTPGNAGGQYRSTDVDIEATLDTGGGYNVGWVAPGEWLKYSVTVATSGTYTLEFRVASYGGGGTFHLDVDGTDVTGPITVPLTGSWQTWTFVASSGVHLNAGEQVWRVVFDAVGQGRSVANLNYIRVVETSGAAAPGPFGGTPASLPGTFQAEDFDEGGHGVAHYDSTAANRGSQYRDSSVDIERTQDAGGGYNLGWVTAGEWLNYTVNVGSTGTYDLEVRVASPGQGGTFHLEISGVDRTGPIAIPATGSWQTWVTVRKTGLSLTAGRQVWRLVMDTNGSGATSVGNINFIRVLSGAAGPAGSDIVLHASDVSAITGNWARAGAADAAGGEQMQSIDLGWQNTTEAAAAPADMFEARFAPEANRAYRVWLRMRAGADSNANDSVWVQFANAVDAAGAPLWRSGTASALLVTLEPCQNCGVSGWGWSNNAWWLADDAIVRFPTGSEGTIRIQTREDGAMVDQIVLSPVTYFNTAPGTRSNDATIVRRNGDEPAPEPNGAPTVSIATPASGESFTAPAEIAISASAADADGAVTRVDFFAGTQLVGSATVNPWTVTWADVAAGTYSLTAVALDDAGATTTSAPVSVTVSAPPNRAPTVSIATPASGATYTAPAAIAITASATDADGTVTRVDFFAGPQLVGSATTSPWSMTWSDVAAGTYALTAVARDDAGATTTSAPLSVTVNPPPPTSGTTTLAFNPSPDHDADVTSYSVAIYRAGDPITATPAATRDLGKPTPAENDITADISDMVNPLPPGSYYAVVTALGPAGSSGSAPSAEFTK